MNVRSSGDPSEMSSLLCAYSNSKATMTQTGSDREASGSAIRGSRVDAEKSGDVGGRSGRDSQKADGEQERTRSSGAG